MLSPIFLPFLSHGSCTIAVQRQISYISFSPFLPFFTFSPTLLWQSLKIFFPFLLLTETISITPKYLPYLSLIILSFLFHSYSSATKIRIFLSEIFNTSCPPPSILYFEILHLAIWSFPFLSPIFSILQTEISNYAYCHQHRAATKVVFPSFYCRQLKI